VLRALGSSLTEPAALRGWQDRLFVAGSASRRDFVPHRDPASDDEWPIQCLLVGSGTGWTRQAHVVTIRAMARELRIDKLSDEFGMYSLTITCACGRQRTVEPHTLGRLCGWDARLEDVAKRMRCSKCGKKQCSLRAIPPAKPRGYSALPR
jgi:hypothetical protein